MSTALNTSYLAERIALFGIVTGIALVLAGIGLVILALAVFSVTGLISSRYAAE